MLNNVIERDVDRRMERTRRRPTASGRIPPARATLAGLAGVAAGAAALWAVAGGLAARLRAARRVLLRGRLHAAAQAAHRAQRRAGRGGRRLPRPHRLGGDRRGLVRRDPVPLRARSRSGRRRTPGRSPWRSATTTAPPGIPTPPARYGDAGDPPAHRRLRRRAHRGARRAARRRPVRRRRTRPAWSLAVRAALGVHGCACSGGRPPAAAWALFKVTGPCLALVLAAAVDRPAALSGRSVPGPDAGRSRPRRPLAASLRRPPPRPAAK